MASYDDLLSQYKSEQKLNSDTAAPTEVKPLAGTFDDIFDEAKRSQRSNMAISVGNAVKGNPDFAGQVNQISRELGLPAETVASNFEKAGAIYKQKLFEAQQSANDDPVLANKYADPKFASVAVDDYHNMSKVGGEVRKLGSGEFTGSYMSAVEAIVSGDYEGVKNFGKNKNPYDRSATDYLKDTGVTIGKGVINVGQAAVGIIDIPFTGWVGKQLEKLGFAPEEAKRILDDYKSDAQKEADRRVQEAEGPMATAKAALENPSVIMTTVGESIPSMLGGGAIARGLGGMRGLASNVIGRAAVGEGAVTAGSIAEQTREEPGVPNITIFGEEREPGRLTKEQALVAAGAGGVTGLINMLSGRVAQRLGITDIDVLFAGKNTANPALQKGLIRQMFEGGAVEGFFEELPQSAQEQLAQNYAQGKPLLEGMDKATVLGLFAGIATGGGTPLATYPINVQAQRDAAKKAEDKARVMEELGKLMAANKVVGRDEQSFQSYVDEVSEGGQVNSVYIKADVLQQSGVIDQIAAAIPSVRDQLESIATPDQEIQISIPDYTAKIAGTDANAVLMDNLRVEGEQMTRAEARSFIEKESEVLQEAYKQAQNTKVTFDEFKKSAKAVEADLLGQFNQANLWPSADNKVQAALYSKVFSAIALRTNQTPEQAYQQFKTTIAMEGQANAGPGFSQTIEAIQTTPEFQEFFGKSVLTKDGKPMILFHGTSDNVAEFDLDHPNRKDTGWLGTGVYLTDSTDMADAYSMQKRNAGGARPNVMPLYARLENPYMATDEDKARLKAGGRKAADAFAKQLKAEGYDGVIYQAAPDAREIVVFDPASVKSIFNEGSWSRDTKDLLMQRGIQLEGKTVPESVDAVSNVNAAFEHAAGRTFKTNRDFKLDIQNRVLEAANAAKVDLSDFTKSVEQYLVRVALADSMTALETNPNAVGWYNEKVTKALRIVSLIHPEIATDPQAKFAFTWALAVTSNGLKVDKNFELAERAYSYYKENGKMPTDIAAGEAQIAINGGLDLFNELIEKHGFEAVEKFMTTRQTVKEVEAFTGKKVSGENLTTEVYGAAAIGPKIGNGFFANLYGHFEQLTMDRWFVRTWGRWTATLVKESKENVKIKRTQLKALIQAMSAQERKALEKIIKTKLLVGKNESLDAVAKAINKASMKPANRVAMAAIGQSNDALKAKFDEILGSAKKDQKRISIGDEVRKVGNALTGYMDGQKEIPSGPPERGRMRKVMGQVLEQMQQQYPALTMSDLQALLWYPEKRLYDAAKTAEEGVTGYEDDEAPDYANAAAALAKELGISQEVIDQTIAEVDNELQTAERARRAERGDRNGLSGEAAVLQQAGVRTESEQNLVDAINENGGITLNGDGSLFEGKDGYIATLRSITVDSVDQVPEAIKAYAEENAGLLGLDGVVIGAFAFNDGTGRVSVDLNIVTQDKNLALQIGREMNQISVWDVANGQEIKTGGNSGAGMNLEDAEAFIRNIGEQYGIQYNRSEGSEGAGSVTDTGVAQGRVEGLRQSGFSGEGSVQLVRASGNEVGARYGKPIADAVSVLGYHFSKEPRAALDARFYGTGLKGAEGARLQQSEDPRIKHRIHFYVDTGQGVNPESGVGAYAHAIHLDNLYDVVADPLGLKAQAAANGIDPNNLWFNGLESAIIDAGYDGVYIPGAQGSQGVAVILGDHTVQPQQIAAPAASQTAPRTQARGTPVFTKYFEQPTRGYIDPKNLVTILTTEADRSTPGHELAHAVIEIYTRIANTENAPAEIVSDLDKLLQFAGVDGASQQDRLANWSAMDLDQQRPFHEAIAYNWEIYLAEGKAPSVELQGVFDRLSQWIRDLYTAVRESLNNIYKAEFGKDLPIMTEGVREVFDRMLASQEQIAQAEAVRNMQVLFDGKPEGMDDAQWAALKQLAEEARDESISKLTSDSIRQMRWLSNAKMRVIKQMQREVAALRAEVRQQVEAELKMAPINKAISFIKDGVEVLPDGTTREASGLHKISIAGLEDLYMGEGDRYALFDWSQLPKSMYGKEGIHPDVLAEQLGYASGDEMVRALIAAPSFKEAVRVETDKRMLDQYGDMNNQKQIDLAVERALHNEARSRFVAAQLRFVSRATAPARAMILAAKRAAQKIVSEKLIKDLKPGEYSIAEARSNREAIAAQKNGDAQEVIRAMQATLMNNQLAGVAAESRSLIDKGLIYLRKVTSDANRKRIGADAGDQIDSLLERFDLSLPGNRIKSMAEWMKKVSDAGYEPDISPEMLNDMFRKPYKMMTVQEFKDLIDTVRQIEHLGRNEQSMLTAANEASYKQARDQMVETALANSGGKQISQRTAKTKLGKVLQGMQKFMAEHIKAATVARILDGGKEGAFWEYLIRPANAAADRETQMRADATRDITKILLPILKAGKMGGKGIMFPSIGRALNKEERIAIALNVGNEGNLQRLLDGESKMVGGIWSTGWTLEQIMPVLESLTAAELNAVQQIWDYSEQNHKPLIAEQWRRLYGKEPNWVDPRPMTVNTADGNTVELRGGYYPIVYDPRAGGRAEELHNDDINKMMNQGAISATVNTSFAKSREQVIKGRPLLLSLSGVYNGINNVIHAIAWQDFVIDANKLLRSHSIDEAIRDHYKMGPEFKQQLKQWVKDVAVGEQVSQDGGAQAVNFVRQSVSAAGLGFNIMSALQQVTGFSSSIVKIGTRYVGRGVAKTMANPAAAIKMVYGKSSFMANRGKTQFRELNELRNMVQGETAVGRNIKLGTYLMMAQMQRMVDVPTWIGAYEKAIVEGNEEARAIALADQAVIDSQGGGMLKDLSKIERGGPWMKLFTVFYSYMNTQFNLAVAEGITEKSKAKLAAKALMLTVVPVVLAYAIKHGLTPDNDDEWDWEKIAKDLAAENLSYLMGTMVLVRELGGAAKIVVGAEGGNRGYPGPAGVRALGDLYNFATQASQGDFDSAFRKAAINLLGDFTGLPSAQINRTINGIDALIEGKTENPAAVLTGFEGR